MQARDYGKFYLNSSIILFGRTIVYPYHDGFQTQQSGKTVFLEKADFRPYDKYSVDTLRRIAVTFNHTELATNLSNYSFIFFFKKLIDKYWFMCVKTEHL